MNIKFTAPFTDGSGYAEASRQTLQALLKAQVGVTTEIVRFDNRKLDTGIAGEMAERLEGANLDYNIKLIELTPNMFFEYLEPGKYHIGFMFWEVKGIDKRWVWYLNKMDEIWISSFTFAKELQKAGVVVPIVYMQQPLELGNTKKIRPFQHKYLKGKFVFYSMFQWTERKNPRKLLETYWKTFQGKKDVVLVLKVYRADYSEEQKTMIRSDIETWKKESGLKKFPEILLVLDPLSRHDILRLHATGDVFVSAHRGEGWGMPQHEAMLMGKPVISTNFGGLHEILDNTVSWLVSCKFVPVFGMGHIEWYNPNQLWAEVNKKSLARAMRDAYISVWKPIVKGKRAKRLMEMTCCYFVVGERMKSRLREIERRIA